MLQAQLKAHYNADVLPTMGTGATDMAQVRSKGYPVLRHRSGGRHRGRAGKGFGAHSDQERSGAIINMNSHRLRLAAA